MSKESNLLRLPLAARLAVEHLQASGPRTKKRLETLIDSFARQYSYDADELHHAKVQAHGYALAFVLDYQFAEMATPADFLKEIANVLSHHQP